MAREPVFPPAEDRLFLPNGRVTDPWNEWFSNVAAQNASMSQRVGTVSLTAQQASISATSIPIQNVTTALYRVSYYTRITQAATTSSSLTVTFGWTESTVSLSASGAAITGNTTTSQQNAIGTFLVDGASPITYSTTYSSTGATPMQYRIEIRAEVLD